VVAPGSVSAIPVSSIDVLPTLCDATRAALPEERTIDGLSLMPILRNTGGLDRDSLFWHFPHYRGKDVVPYSIVRKGDWKLIYYYDGSPSELYNLAEDLAEKHDQAESQPERLSELETELRTWLESTGARLPKPNPDFSPPPGDPETVS
jgi:arylsulfatase A-like enzyme